MKSVKFILILIALQFTALTSFATIDSLARYNFVYLQNIQEEPLYDYSRYVQDLASGYNSLQAYCVGQGLFWDGVSSSIYPIFEFMTKPFNIESWQLLTDEQVNINELSNSYLKIDFTYDSVTSYTDLENGNYLYTPSFTVDVSAFPKTNDTEIFTSLVYAKLAILGIFSNLELYYPNTFSAKIDVVGLPDQTNFISPNFSKVHASTKFNYSSASPVAQAYKDELLSPFCR